MVEATKAMEEIIGAINIVAEHSEIPETLRVEKVNMEVVLGGNVTMSS